MNTYIYIYKLGKTVYICLVHKIKYIKIDGHYQELLTTKHGVCNYVYWTLVNRDYMRL